MSYHYSELIYEVRDRLGKGSDTVLLTTARVGGWLSDAQKKIVRKYPGLRDVNIVDKDTFKLGDGVWEYDLADLPYDVAHIERLKYIDTSGKDYYVIEPYVGGLDQWDNDFPYIPNANLSGGISTYYIRRGNKFELCPMPGSSQYDKPIWIEYSRLPPDMKGVDDVTFKGTGTGTAMSLTVTGTYTGATSNRYRVEITGVAEYKWTNDDGTTWTTTVTPSASATTLEYGLSLTFAIATGFTTGDYWTFQIDDPLLTDFDESLIGLATSKALRALGQKQESLEQEMEAWRITQERVDGEADFDEIDQIADNGP